MRRSLLVVVAVVVVAACASQPAKPPPDVATGTIDVWQAGPPLPVARANHCAVAIEDWILAIGGNHADGSGGFIATDEIDAAQLAPDGTLGPWQVAGHLPSPASECTATSDGRHLYVVDAIYDDSSLAGQIFTADLDASGQLGAFASPGALPAGVVAISSGASVHDGSLLVMHTQLPDEGDTTVMLRTPLAGALAWSTDDWRIGFRAQAQFAFTAGFAYVLGGYHDPAVGAVADVHVAPLGASVGAAVAATALPQPTAFGEAVAVDAWLFVAGGRAQVFGAPGTTTVVAAPIAPDGSLGAWQPATPLPVPRTNHALVASGDFLVITGGAAMGAGDTTVLVARVRYPK